MDEFLSEFLVECHETLQTLDQDIVALEQNPSDTEVLKRVFRAIHSVKGTCGMFGLARLEKVAHVTEDVLSKMRDGALPVSANAIGLILIAIDVIKAIIQGLEESKAEPQGDDTEIINKLKALAEGKSSAPDSQQKSPVGAAKAQSASLAEQTLRVHVDILDHLMNLVGELVLTRNQLLQFVQKADEPQFFVPIQHLNRVTSGLQEVVMKMRMQPIENAWAKLPRIVRDLSQSSGKQIDLVMSGKETEIDRQVLQAIQDPLVHCVRNSADHGIELPEARVQKGKSANATIALNAFHEGGHIIIEIKDDGAGVNLTAVRQKAIERGLIKEEDKLTQAETLQLIFEPGFSTAQQVTEVSGRGVGMDVVRTNIQKIGGTVDLFTDEGRGTTVRIKIPLTLAIIPALIVGVGAEGFAIPQGSVLELVRVSGSSSDQIEEIHGARVLRLRDSLLPLIDLASALGLPVQPHEDLSVVVVQVGESQFGICVDDIFDTQEIVVKPVGRLIQEANLFAGTTILGDGRVILILDVARIAAKALPSLGTGKGDSLDGRSDETDYRGEQTSLLLFFGGDDVPLAVPLALVSRLEEFPVEKLERVDGRDFVQYRGALLPLIMSKPALSAEYFRSKNEKTVPAIIFSDGRRSMGMVVSEVSDIVEEVLRIESRGENRGILGAAIIDGRVTEVIDTYHYLSQAYPDWFEDDSKSEGNRSIRLLLVDDFEFFRKLLKPILEARGYEVETAVNGEDALRVLEESRERGRNFDLILSDIEMPKMDGLELAQRVRSSSVWKAVPMLALTSLAGPQDRQKGLAAGFTDYLPKFDRDSLFIAIDRVLGAGAENRTELTT